VSTFQNLYEGPGNYLSLERAVDLDKKYAEHPTYYLDQSIYRQPILVVKDVQQMPYRRPLDNEFNSGKGCVPLGGTEKLV
jgi:hypothetical protein